MTHEFDDQPEVNELQRSRLGLKVGAAAGAVLIVGAGAFALLNGGETSSAGESNTPTTYAPVVPGESSQSTTKETAITTTTASPESSAEVLTVTRFKTYEDIQATVDFLEPSELILNSPAPNNLDEAIVLTDQYFFNATVSTNLGYGLDVLTDPLYYKPYDESWNGGVEEFKDGADIVGQERVRGDGPETVLSQELNDHYNFERLSDNIFKIYGNIERFDNPDAQTPIAVFEDRIYWFIQDEVTIENGSTHITWMVINQDQVVELIGKS